jgi:hypothetical protein
MANQDTVGQRFVQLIAHLGISKNAFAVSLGKTATVIQHLVDERNKPGFDLLDKVFEVYPNVSMAWLMKGVGPMFTDDTKQPISELPQMQPASVAEQKAPSVAAVTEKPAPIEEQPAPVTPPIVPPAVVVPAPAVAPAPVPTVPPVALAPIVAAEAPAPTADTSWQTALYTQQMAHQLALAELRNQHLQEQQRLMQQMMDLMQRQLAR